MISGDDCLIIDSYGRIRLKITYPGLALKFVLPLPNCKPSKVDAGFRVKLRSILRIWIRSWVILYKVQEWWETDFSNRRTAISITASWNVQNVLTKTGQIRHATRRLERAARSLDATNRDQFSVPSCPLALALPSTSESLLLGAQCWSLGKTETSLLLEMGSLHLKWRVQVYGRISLAFWLLKACVTMQIVTRARTGKVMPQQLVPLLLHASWKVGPQVCSSGFRLLWRYWSES